MYALPEGSVVIAWLTSHKLVPHCLLNIRFPAVSYSLTKESRPPWDGPSRAPSVWPVTQTFPEGSTATPFAASLVDVPNCFVHCSSPAELNLRTNASMLPALVPSRLPAVDPATNMLPSASVATSFDASNAVVPN